MADILMTSVPIHGHVAPLLTIAEGLIARGHTVRFLTGTRFAEKVAASGARFLPLPGAADYDDRELATDRTNDVEQRPGKIRGMRADVTRVFLAPAADQYRALTEALREPTDVVLTEPTFVAASLLAALPRSERPPVVGLGIVPLLIVSLDAPPYGAGLTPLPDERKNRRRNRVLNALVQRVLFRPVQRDYDALFRRVHGHGARTFVLDVLSALDAVVQFTVPSFEYPRHDLRVPLHYAGPALSTGRSTAPDPAWWPELAGDRPVVLVTQGTLANTDLGELVLPTVHGLADDDVLVVVTTGGPPVEALGALPANVRAAEFLDYGRLLEHVDVFVTNGGYGGVHHALAHGVPLVVAGVTEDKPEVAARVEWAGVGVNLRTGRPDAAAVAGAVRQVLGTPSYRERARQVAAEMAAAPGLDLLDEVVGALVAERLTST